MYIPGHKHVYDVRTDRIGGGCSLYIHDAIPFKQKKVLELGEVSMFIAVNSTIFNTNKNVILAVIYRSPDSTLGLFNKQLEPTLLQVDKEKTVAILSGDFKCDTYRELSVNSLVTQDLINTFSSFNPIRSRMIQTANDPGGGGGALKAPHSPYDREKYCINLHYVIHVHFTRCFRHVPIGIYHKFAMLTILQRFQNEK